MKIVVYHNGMHHQEERAYSFAKGCDEDVLVAKYGRHHDCDLAVFWGMHASRDVRYHLRKTHTPFLVMERGYVGDRFRYTSLGYNGLNNRGDFLNADCSPDRWNRLFAHHMKPRKEGGEYILLTGQVPGDASLKELGFPVDYDRIVRDIQAHTDRPIHYRAHPVRGFPCPNGAIDSTAETLEESMSGAHCVVTINSTTSVDATLYGKPCLTLDRGSLAWDVTFHDFSQIEKPPAFDRKQWAYNLAYTQWSPEEMESGEAWQHLRKCFYGGVKDDTGMSCFSGGWNGS